MRQPLTCQETLSLLTEYRERALPWDWRLRTRMHLWRCPQCEQVWAELEALPEIIGRCDLAEDSALAPIAEAALTGALLRLREPHSAKPIHSSPIPEPVRQMLGTVADLPLRLMALTHAAMAQGRASRSEPFLPDDVLAELPPAASWKWRHIPGGIRRALLWKDEQGVSLSLVFMPPNFSPGAHRHLGSESVLVLDGEMEHADRCLVDGDWIHLECGSQHAPHAFGRGCWCLVRDEGGLQFEGPMGWFKGMLAGA